MRKTSQRKPSRSGRKQYVRGLDDLTRQRLLEAGGEVFSKEGFYAAKVRDICARAGANVAAVNYHFGDKLGLYTEVLRYSLSASISDETLQSIPVTAPPKEKLKIFVRTALRGMFSRERQAWHAKLMMHEMVQPTPALDYVIDQLIRPKFRMLRELIGSMIGQDPDAYATHLCAHSVIGQVRHYVIGRDAIERLSPEVPFTTEGLDEIVEHITTFSFAALENLRRHTALVTTKRIKRNETIGVKL